MFPAEFPKYVPGQGFQNMFAIFFILFLMIYMFKTTFMKKQIYIYIYIIYIYIINSSVAILAQAIMNTQASINTHVHIRLTR